MVKQITISTTHEATELIADILYSVSDQGVNIFDKQDLLDIINADDFWDYVDEEALKMSELVTVSGYVSEDSFKDALETIKNELEKLKKNAVINLGSLEINIFDVDENAWRDEWKKSYSTVRDRWTTSRSSSTASRGASPSSMTSP